MTELEIRENILNLKSQLSEIINNGESEKRKLDENEESKIADLRMKIDEAENEIKKIEEENRKLSEKNNQNKETRKQMEVRLFDLIKGVTNGNLTDEQRAYVSGNKIDMRGVINAGTAGQGQENVPEEKKSLDLAIRNASVLNKLGATWFADAVGDVDAEFRILSIAVG